MTDFLPIEALSSLSAQAQSLVAAAQSQSVAGAVPGMPAGASSPTGASAAGSFGQMVSDGISQVNSKLISNQVDLQKLALGDAQNLHQLMINLEESRVSFQMMMQVRSRLLEAYQDIMKMPI
ncbi:flagellar hook-basal body complex protein FliE [Variovorax paradoxus]|uniref:flagellar hook-basal body complex protein FliE n=1 Tax=Variovorax paradoxus TaxID=34073 RepID=UPI0029C7AAE6|nr:flagellar hook-basal body complex protein FliE [Variovorax paradoxus]